VPAHLRPLPRCRRCHAPATSELRNTNNGVVAIYCDRCGPGALAEFRRQTEPEEP
jgi:hypothetical protein